MKVIGVTGGVGAGKSTVLALLEKEKNACILKADEIGHLVMEPGERCYEAVIELFDFNVLKSDKTIDRKRISDVVFSDTGLLKSLNAIIHPAVREYILQRIEEERKAGREICVVEAALFLEAHYEEFCDEVWYVRADPEVRILRLMENRGYTREKSLSIMESQCSEEIYRAHADVIIDNSGSFEETRKQVLERFI